MNEIDALHILQKESIEIGPDETRSVIEIAVAHKLGNVALQKPAKQVIIKANE